MRYYHLAAQINTAAARPCPAKIARRYAPEDTPLVTARPVAGGVDTGRLDAQGFGETLPIDDNKTDKGGAANRHVDIKIT